MIGLFVTVKDADDLADESVAELQERWMIHSVADSEKPSRFEECEETRHG
jgi:hypothetical protein